MCLPKQVSGAAIQTIATIVGNLLCLNFGITFGVTPAHIDLYQSTETPLNRPASEATAAWVSGLLFVSAAFGSLIFGLMTQRIGPKSVLLLSGLLQITGWFCVHFAYDMMHIYSSRIAAGIAAGATFTVLPVYITEISEDANCGRLTASIDKWRALGILIGLVLGEYVPYEQVSLVGIGLAFVFTMTFPFVQESPYYFMRKGNVASLEKALRWFRGIRDIDDRDQPEYLKELAEFKSKMQDQYMSNRMSAAYLLKVFLFCLVLSVGAQFTGVYVILNYGDEFFAEVSSAYTSHVSVLILAGVQLVGAFFAYWLQRKLHSKLLFLITALICSFSLIAFGLIAVYGGQWHINPLFAPWLPLGLLSLHMLSANVGIFPLASTITGEMMPSKLRSNFTSITNAFSWLLVFALIQCFYGFTYYTGLVGVIWLFAAVCLVSGAFVLILLPETSGKSLEEVQEQMGYVASGNVAKITTVTNGHITHGHI